ncbi:MAG: hypothetical protein ACOYKE_10350 [Ferruginibacter sp.]
MLKNSSIAQQNLSFKQNDITISFTSAAPSARTNFSFSINRGTETVAFSNLVYSASSQDERIAVAKTIEKLVNGFTAKISTETLRTFILAIDNFCEQTASKITTDQIKKEDIQSLFVCRAIVVALLRKIENGGIAITCTANESYVRQLSSFSSEEDHFINVNQLKKYITTNTNNALKKGGDYILAALKNVTAEKISTADLKLKLNAYFLTQGDGRWPRGTDCGCCGNYSGPCYYWSSACLTHDLHCQTCTPRWYCLSGCVPSVCK